MNKVANILIVCGCILLLVLAFVYRQRTAPSHENPAVIAQDLSDTASAMHTQSPPEATVSLKEIPASSNANLRGSTLGWSEKVDAILAADVSESDKVRSLLELFPHLPEAGQVEVANHLSNLLPNEDYTRLAVLVTNAALPPDVLEVLVRDAFNRPNGLKVPVLIDVASNARHPKAVEAKETLVLLLGQDEGEDWVKWREKGAEWLKANPD